MANTNIKLFKQCKVTKDRNALVENIAQYLNGFSATNIKEFANAQYQKIELHKTLKLELPQAQVGKEMYNYVDIFQDVKHFYYFIDKASWKSTTTVELELTLDTVNTFADDFTFNKKTRITRQHKDRLKEDFAVVQNWDVWDYIPADVSVILNPWASENEMHDIFYVRGLDNLTSCKVLKRNAEGTILQTWENVTEVGQDYVGESGTAMYFKWHDEETTFSVVLEYDDLIADFNNDIYYTIVCVGNVSDLVYYSDWQSLFYGIYQERLVRIVDKQPENVNPPLFKNQEEYQIQDSNTSTNWYLVYKTTTADESASVQCQLWPQESLNIKIRSSMTKQPSDFTTNTYYYFLPRKASHANIMHKSRYFNYGNDTMSDFIYATNVDTESVAGKIRNETSDYHNVDGSFWFLAYRSGDDLIIEQYKVHDNFWGQIVNEQVQMTVIPSNQSFKFTGYLGSVVNYYTYGSKITNITTLWQNANNDLMNHSYFTATTTTRNLKSFNEIDRTDSKLIKIIALPYAFVNVTADDVFSSDAWQYDADGFLYLDNPNARFMTTIDVDYNPLEELLLIDRVEDGINRDNKYESKIYNSEFYTPKFVYDSFNYAYQLENISSPSMLDLETNTINYQVTSTINSRFLFGFNIPLDRSTNDYDRICIVTRNNELPIYSNGYLNYIRTGYNYDVKNKNLNLAKGGVSLAASAAGGALATGLAVSKIGAAAGSTVGPVGTAVGAGVGAAIGLAAGFITLSISQAQADQQIQQKIDEAQRQATSVSAADDIDLLETYTNGNKAKYVTYQCSDRVKNSLLDLFFYCGYATNEYGIPNLNTRKYFNYIECEPVFNEENNTIYQEFLDNIKERYRAGVTVYHDVNPDLQAATYDWNQAKENWETSLL